MIRIHARYALESVRGRDPQDVVDLIAGVLATGISGCCAVCSDSMDLNSDDSGVLRESKKLLVLRCALTRKRRQQLYRINALIPLLLSMPALPRFALGSY